MIIPLKIAGKYMRSHIVIGFLETGFTLLVNACIIKKFIYSAISLMRRKNVARIAIKWKVKFAAAHLSSLDVLTT